MENSGWKWNMCEYRLYFHISGPIMYNSEGTQVRKFVTQCGGGWVPRCVRKVEKMSENIFASDWSCWIVYNKSLIFPWFDDSFHDLHDCTLLNQPYLISIINHLSCKQTIEQAKSENPLERIQKIRVRTNRQTNRN